VDENEKQEKQDASQKQQGTAFRDMKPEQKLMFVLKVMVCVATMGFAFPNVMAD
jgi:hypothetical protein